MAQQQSTTEYLERCALVPQELRDCPQWVAYKLVWNPERLKMDKVPVNPHTGYLASSTSPKTWGTYQQALTAYKRYRHCAGIGFVFTEHDDFFGIDLDHCISEAGEVEGWAMDVINFISSYTEVSPSGTGVHIICKASWEDTGKKKDQVEMYRSGRFFTITGNHIPNTPLTVEERTEQVTEVKRQFFGPDLEQKVRRSRRTSGATAPVPLSKPPLTYSDQRVIAKLKAKASGAETLALLSGSRNGHPSQSEAEFSAAKNLMYWCDGKVEQADRIIRNHPIYRKKWDEVHGDETYGQRTLRKAHEYYLSKKEER